MKKGLWVILALCISFSSWAAEKVKGNGNLVTTKIAITDYNVLKLDGLMDFTYEQSDEEPYLEITLDENLFEYLTAEVKDRTLSIALKDRQVESVTSFKVRSNSKWLKEIKATGNANFMVMSPLVGDEMTVKGGNNSLIQIEKPIQVGALRLDVGGNANIVVDDLTVDKLNCDMSGAGSIRLKNGKAATGEFTIASSSDIHAFGCEISDLNCKIAGSGTTEFHVTNNLKVTIIGSGKVRYKGPTAVQQKVIGKGSVEEVK